MTVEKVLKWLDEEGGVKGTTVCDAGCGTGGSNTELMICSDRTCLQLEARLSLPWRLLVPLLRQTPYVSCLLKYGISGSLAIPLALRGATVCASDISSAMASEAQAR